MTLSFSLLLHLPTTILGGTLCVRAVVFLTLGFAIGSTKSGRALRRNEKWCSSGIEHAASSVLLLNFNRGEDSEASTIGPA